MKKNLANIITSTRIIGSLLMIPIETLSSNFFIIYIFCGISDALDGYVARSTNSVSSFGSKLDSFSDLLFYTTMMIKILPFLREFLPSYIWMIVNVTLVLRVLLYLYVLIKEKELISNHTILNKLTGLLLFLLPLVLKTKIFIGYSLLVSLVAFIAATYEYFLVFGKKGQ